MNISTHNPSHTYRHTDGDCDFISVSTHCHRLGLYNVGEAYTLLSVTRLAGGSTEEVASVVVG